MIEHRLKAAFDPFFEAPLRVWVNFSKHCELVHFKKNTIIKRAGKIERNGYFILKGSAGTFVRKDDKYVCLDLFFDNQFFGDTMSLYTGEPTQVETLTFEDCEMLKISKDNIALLKQTEIGKNIFLIAAEFDYVEKQTQQIDLLLKTAEQRYIELVHKQPNIVLRIPQKYIASYLGITTQSLSRIRRNVKKYLP